MRYVLMILTGIAGAILLAGTYYLLWVGPNTQLEDVIMRTRMAMLTGILGSVMCVFYILRRYR